MSIVLNVEIIWQFLSSHKSWISVLLSMSVICLLLPGAASAREKYGVSVIAIAEDGEVLVDTAIASKQDWRGAFKGDPLTLQHGRILSTIPDPVKYLDGELDVKYNPKRSGYRYHLLFRHPEATTACPFPIYPKNNLFGKVFLDGAGIFFRLPEGVTAKTVIASYKGKQHQLVMITPEFLAKEQTAGDEPLTQMSWVDLEWRVSRLDNLSIAAYSSANPDLQSSLIPLIGQTVSELIGRYYELFECYPSNFCQLYNGPTKIIGTIPLNPFKPSVTICGTEHTQVPLRGTLRYFPEFAGKGVDNTNIEAPIGYWLACIVSGKDSVEPLKAFPSYHFMPISVAKWYEAHPSEIEDENENPSRLNPE